MKCRRLLADVPGMQRKRALAQALQRPLLAPLATIALVVLFAGGIGNRPEGAARYGRL
jgi:hypothetical protein